MNCWEMLGIAATSDLAAIKTAYAAKAKERHPEEYPEEFKQLQQAYRTASRFAKAQKEHTVLPKEYSHVAAEVETQSEAAKEDTYAGSVQEEISKKEVPAEKTAPEEINSEQIAAGEIKTGEIKTGEITPEEIVSGEPVPDKTVLEETEREETARQEDQQYFDYEAVAEAELFDYRATMQADLNDRFFTEFFSIAWNPYLMNNLTCWEYMLKSSPYDELLSSEAFRYNFVKTVCHSLSGWQRKTLLFFEKWLQSRTAGEEEQGQKKETDLLCWKFKKIGLLERLVSTQRCAAKEQKELHDILLAKVQRCGRSKSLESKADVECYLSFYLPYAAEKQSAVKEMYYDSCQGRMFLYALLFFVPLIIGMVIYVNVYVAPRESEKIRQEAAQKKIQSQSEELKKYNESFWDDDYIGGQWLQEHQEELRQELQQNYSELFRDYYEELPDSKEIEEMLAETEAMGSDVFDSEAASDGE